MANITTAIAVADNASIEGDSFTLEFKPGASYPDSAKVHLKVHDQPFPLDPPTRVVPAILGVFLSFGHTAEGTQPPPIEPAEHALRELSFEADYVPGSWHVEGSRADVEIFVSAGLRDNSPSGDSPPDDPYVAYVRLQALCIWTTEQKTFLERIVQAIRGGVVRNK
jgi:hypothetical protein